MEFERLLYPIRYNVIVRVFNHNPVEIIFRKNGEAQWTISEAGELPGWIHELTMPIQNTIEENEKEINGEDTDY
jgi:hypothetical protein